MIDYGYLVQLFEACLTAEYRHVEEEGSFSVLRDGEMLYLFFEKSNGAVDWYHNLSYGSVPYEGGSVHEGFLRVWTAVLPYLKELIESPTVRQIISVGYSHGGALALLCHEYIWRHRADLRGQLWGFGYGCPRVIYGRYSEEREIWSSFYRVVNRGDLVTLLPPSVFGYRHVGRQIAVGKSGAYSPIDAHRAENYIKELEKLAYRAKST